jgi:hypothetical protein
MQARKARERTHDRSHGNSVGGDDGKERDTSDQQHADDKERDTSDQQHADEGPLLIYTSRSQDKFSFRRVTSNEDALIHALREFCAASPHTNGTARMSLHVFHGSKTPLLQAVRLFSRAKIVVGVHGAALANLVFLTPAPALRSQGKGTCRSSTPVTPALLEVTMPTGYEYPTGFRDYAHLAAALGITYWVLPQARGVGYAAAVEVDLPAVLEAVQRIADSQQPRARFCSW